MAWFQNLKIGGKLGFGFGVCLLLAALAGLVAQKGFGTVNENVYELQKDSFAGLVVASEISDDISLARIKQYRLAGTEDEELRGKLTSLIDGHRADVAKAIKDYETTIFKADDRENHNALKSAWSEYDDLYQKMVSSLTSKNRSSHAFTEFDKASTPIYLEKLMPAVEKIHKWNEGHAVDAFKDIHVAVAKGSRLAYIFLGIALTVGALMAFFIAKSIKKPVGELAARLTNLEGKCLTQLEEGLKAIAEGDLRLPATPSTKPIPDPSKDEVGQMSATFNRMLNRAQETIVAYNLMRTNLSELVGNIQSSSSDVASTSAQLDQAAAQTGHAATSIAQTIQQVALATDETARSSSQIATGAEQLAHSAEEAATAMGLLQTYIANVQQGSSRQSVATSEASETAESVSKAVEETVASMNRIQHQVSISSEAISQLGEKGKQIGDIVQTIEDIAQQTNLLALNAAIEAARAGEQGKGFAVVADEVRKLAERSASATQEIATLIGSVKQGVEQAVSSMEASNEEVRLGASSSAEAGDAIKQILEAVQTASTIATANAQAIEEMEAGAKIVTEAISSAAAISEETAAGAEEMSASIEEVSASTQTVSAAVEEQTAQIEEVGASAQNLSRLAEDLNLLASRFKVEGDETVKLRVAA